jgi:putative hydrolase
MDAVGPDVVPSVERIRASFEARRHSGGGMERFVRRILGVEMKMRQYAEGARFVRAVVDRVGMDGLNRVWTAPELLPDAAEIRAPEQWLARVHPRPPAMPAVND